MATQLSTVERTRATPGRRRILGLVARGAAALGAAALAARPAGDALAGGQEQLIGSWLVAAGPTAPPRILVSFTRDGVALRTAPVRQAAPPALGVPTMIVGTTHGGWSRIGRRTFALTFVGLAFDEAGAFLATQRVRVAAEVSPDGDSFSGPFQTDFLAADGRVLATVTGTVLATRIAVEPPG
jgi:hypothetical protein